ncbi:osteopontin isoform X2 [Salarias fasciatus]|uniref:Dentin sialophosphoprotein-like n=1 Tax=Salarias fasciatus TaxID=181472 RepID=A0A672JQ78_SALFA|nr:dentin sialophosphoprotein-like isoform X2 [Salarias fasciatus]
MKVAVVFVLLFATVLCQPVRKVSISSSESSEEVARRPAPPAVKKQALLAPQTRAGPAQGVAAAAESDESAESSDEDGAPVQPDSADTTSAPDTASVDSDEDDDDDETEEDETEEDENESSDSSDSESGESSTASPTDVPVVVTDEPAAETTVEPIEPTIVTDVDNGRGDSLGYPSDYKSIIYVEDKSYHKAPAPYKSYEYMGKKTAYDMTDGNEVEKSLKVYKALQIHSDLLEEDTSTPEVESQGLDPRQASLPGEEEIVSTTEATTSESSSTPEEEEEEEEEESTSAATDSASTSQESDDDESQSSEEATATPGAADSDDDDDDSDESESSEEATAAPDATTDMPVVITAK